VRGGRFVARTVVSACSIDILKGLDARSSWKQRQGAVDAKQTTAPVDHVLGNRLRRVDADRRHARSWARNRVEDAHDEVKSLYRAGKYDRAVVVASKALAVAEKNMGADHPSVATSLNNLVALYEKQGQYAAAEPLYKRALAIDEKALGKDHPDVASSLENLAALYRKTDRVKDAEPLEVRAKVIRAIKR